MAKFKVVSVEEQSNGNVNCDTYVLNDEDAVIGHFTVVLDAAEVLAVAGWDKPQRVAAYLALFKADPRISKTVDSEAAVAQMEADIVFPVTVEI